jgi:transcriptional regulator with XRE-family HTH domain
MKASILIKKYRVNRGLSQAAVADMISVDQSTYGRIERGDVELKFDVLSKLLEVLDIKMHSFIEDLETSLDSMINCQSGSNNHFLNNQEVDRISAHYQFLLENYKERISTLEREILELKK